jgi:hypothetical protein
VHLIGTKKTRWNATSHSVLLKVTLISGLLKAATMVKKKLLGMVVVVTKTIRNITIKIAVQISGHVWDAINPWIKTHLGTGRAPGSGDTW